MKTWVKEASIALSIYVLGIILIAVIILYIVFK